MPRDFIGARGRGSHELRGVIGRIDILTGTLGKALGGASGGLRRRAQGNRRLAAPALAALFVLEQHRAARGRGDHCGCSICSRVRRICASACTRMPATSAHKCKPWIRSASRRASHHPDHAGRRAVGGQARGAGSGTGSLCRGLLISGRPPWKSANPHPDECRALSRAARSGRSCVSVRGTRSRNHPLRAVMKALVKARAEPGIWLQDVPEPRSATTTFSSRSIARPSAAPTCTSTTGMRGRRRPFPCRWRSAMSIPAKSSNWAARCAASTRATACPEKATSPAGTAAIAAPAGATCAAIPPAWGSTAPARSPNI